MKRLLMIASLAGLLASTTGCLHHHAQGGCHSCAAANAGCQSGHCGGGCGHGGGLLSRLRPGAHVSGVALGCRPAPLRWQQGGLDYSTGLATGVLGHDMTGRGPMGPAAMGYGGMGYGGMGHGAAAVMQGQPVNPGPPSGTVAYPYYTVRGPRDFLLDNPPSIGR